MGNLIQFTSIDAEKDSEKASEQAVDKTFCDIHGCIITEWHYIANILNVAIRRFVGETR